MRAEVYRRPDGKWSWRLWSAGKIVATDHGQGYEKKGRAREMCEAVISGAYADAPITVED